MVHRVVLDIELTDAEALGQAGRADERGEAGVEAGAGLTRDGQQFAVAPEVLRAPFDLFAGDVDGRVVVDRFEGAEALVADVQRFRREPGVTQMTFEAE